MVRGTRVDYRDPTGIGLNAVRLGAQRRQGGGDLCIDRSTVTAIGNFCCGVFLMICFRVRPRSNRVMTSVGRFPVGCAAYTVNMKVFIKVYYEVPTATNVRHNTIILQY